VGDEIHWYSLPPGVQMRIESVSNAPSGAVRVKGLVTT
jgi:hypothetical protein